MKYLFTLIITSSVSFRGYDVLMSQQFAGGIEVHSHREQGGGKGMTSAMHNLSKSNGK